MSRLPHQSPRDSTPSSVIIQRRYLTWLSLTSTKTDFPKTPEKLEINNEPCGLISTEAKAESSLMLDLAEATAQAPRKYSTVLARIIQ